jgi:hypothetical protein
MKKSRMKDFTLQDVGRARVLRIRRKVNGKNCAKRYDKIRFYFGPLRAKQAPEGGHRENIFQIFKND